MRYRVSYTDKVYGVWVDADSEEEAEQRVINGDYNSWDVNELTGNLVIQSVEPDLELD